MELYKQRTSIAALAVALVATGCTYKTEVIERIVPADQLDDEGGLEQDENAATEDPTPTPPAGDAGAAPEPGDPGLPEDDAGAGAPPPAPELSCREAVGAAFDVLRTHCAGCHDGDTALGGFGNILDADTLINLGRVVAGDAAASRVYARTANGSMPPREVARRPSQAEVAALGRWIDCGAAPFDGAGAGSPGGGRRLAFTTFDEKIRLMERDARAVSNRADRENLRYIDFTPLANAGLTDAELEHYRQALSLQVNSLSRGFGVRPPSAVNDDRTIFRIDLEDYGWDREVWDRIAAEYPFAVRYDEDSNLFPYDENTAERLRDELNTDITFVHGDWFLATVSQAPLYYEILEIPDQLDQLADQLDIDLAQDLEDEQVVRAGIANSNVALNRNRVDERHELPGNSGALWLTFDFVNNTRRRSIFAFPLDFEFDGSEAIHHLANGLQAYSIWDPDGNRLDVAPRDLAFSPFDPIGEVSVQECGVCHAKSGILPVKDDMHELVRRTLSGNERDRVLAIYPGQDTIDEVIQDDVDRFARALRAAGVTDDMAAASNTIFRGYEAPVTLARAAAYLEVSPDELAEALRADVAAFPLDIAALRNRGGSITLDGFLDGFEQTVEALGLGEPLQAPPIQ